MHNVPLPSRIAADRDVVFLFAPTSRTPKLVLKVERNSISTADGGGGKGGGMAKNYSDVAHAQADNCSVTMTFDLDGGKGELSTLTPKI